MVPATGALLDSIDATIPTERHAAEVLGFIHLGGGLVSCLHELSRRCPVAYIETDYVGGAGTQAAAVYVEGLSVMVRGACEARGAVSEALKTLGVIRGKASDEFEAVGLPRYRSMDDWEEHSD